MRDQAKKLIYVCKKLGSPHFKEVIEGLLQSRQYIAEVKIIDFLNTLVIGLLDLFNTAKFSYLRKEAASNVIQCKHFLSQLPSKPQIIGTLSKCLKSSDVVVRILTLQIVIEVRDLFSKDPSVYHLMCSRLKWKEQMSIKQQVRTVQCLRSLLEHSQFLAQMFSNNILQWTQLGGIETKIIVYLCTYAKFQPNMYPSIINSVWQACSNQFNNKVIRHYFGKLIKKGCANNYFCLEQFSKNYIHLMPGIQQTLEGIFQPYYNFLQPNPSKYNEMSDQQLLDTCFESMNVQIQINPDLLGCVENRLLQSIENRKIKGQTLLLFTFYTKNHFKQQYQIQSLLVQYSKPNLGNYSHQQKIKLLKIALTTANFKLAHMIIQESMNSIACVKRYGNALVLFSCYAQLHIDSSQKNLLAFLTILANLAICSKQLQLLTLCKLWKQFYFPHAKNLQNQQTSQIFQYEMTEEQQLPGNNTTMQQEKQKQYEAVPKIAKCQEQIDYMLNFSTRLAPMCISSLQYEKIYFGKRTILDIFNFL